MKFGIILQSNKPEHVWNALRLGIASLNAGHLVKIFLMSEGVEIEDISDSEQFDVTKKLAEFKNLQGLILSCESCLKIRSKGESKACPVSSMKDLVKMIEESDKILVFG